MLIQVKAVPGRIARTAKDGDFIPSDRYVQVELTNYIRRLRDHHGDIVEKPAKAEPAPKPQPQPTADAVKKPAKVNG